MNETPHTTVHKDGTVTYWNVYEQCWHHHAEVVTDSVLATMTSSELDRIARRYRAPKGA